MGSLVKVESSAYTKDVIDIYSSNKVGMYSKYLSLTPEFVTYYSVNQIMSRTDVGTGSVVTERGYNSPLRFNKIKNLPCYNLPVLSPDIVYDETGMDLDLDVNDVVLLPDTVKPTVPDYMIYHLPEGRQLLFRVHSFRYNTIQSNEFVYINLELKEMGTDIEEKMETQVVKTFYTVFENIGTEDKCFIEEEAVETVNGLVDLITECSNIYRDSYWDECIGGYVLPSNYDMRKVIYDVFLTHFINETDLFPHRDTTLTTLPYLDYVPQGSEALYKRSLLYAVEHKTNKLLARDMYYYLGLIKSPFSPFRVYHYEAQSVNLQLLSVVPTGLDLKPYYDRVLKQVLILGQAEYPVWPPIPEEDNDLNNGGETDEETNTENPGGNASGGDQTSGEEGNESTGESGGDTGSTVPGGTETEGDETLTPDENDTPVTDPTNPEGSDNTGSEEGIDDGIMSVSDELIDDGTGENTNGDSGTESDDTTVEEVIPPVVTVKPSIITPANRIYDEFEMAPVIKGEELELSNEDKRQIMIYTEDQKYILSMIIQFMNNTTTQVNFDSIIQVLLTKGRFSYFYGPIIVYILRKTYDSYFTKSTSETD